MNELEKAVAATLEAVREEMPENDVKLVYLTGSRLYGYAKETSDYDFVVYVAPTKRETLFNKKVNREVTVGVDMVEKVPVRNVLDLVVELRKPTVNSLHLLFAPVFYSPFSATMENSLFFQGTVLPNFLENLDNMVETAFRNGRKNLVLSLLGTVKNEKQGERRKEFYMMCQSLAEYALCKDDLDAGTVLEAGGYARKFANRLPEWFEEKLKEDFQLGLELEVKQTNVDYESLFLE